MSLNSDHRESTHHEEYVVVARRYRPQRFDELVGQEHVARALSNAITAQRVGHAYLFTGARGVGKTSAARILAKALNCERGMSPTPCNQCDVCQCISAGNDVDVLEIDGASNRGIDEIRELRQNVNVRPSRARFKIYIIDEVHMLTREAFNALLKTLEEPPEHVKFIFCTTEPEKIPITILSRCQRFDFAGIQTSAIAARLRQIVDAEGVAAEPAALDLLARRAGGSMRDSQSLLEQLLSLGGNELRVADVHELLGTADDRRIAQILEHLGARNAAAALSALDEAAMAGVELGRLLDQLLGYYRDMLVASVGTPSDQFLHVAPSESEGVARLAARTAPGTVLAIMQILDQALGRLRFSTQPRTLVEAALVRVALLDDLDELSAAIANVKSSEAPGQGAVAPRAAATVPAAAAADDPHKKKLPAEPLAPPGPALSSGDAVQRAALSASPPAESRVLSSHLSRSGESPNASHDEPARSGSPRNAVDSRVFSEVPPSDRMPEVPPADPIRFEPRDACVLWQSALAELSGILASNAQKATVESPSPGVLLLKFAPGAGLCKQYCERPEQRARLEQAVRVAAGGPLRLDFVVQEAAPGQTRIVPQRSLTPRELLEQRRDHPLVRRAIDLFDARPIALE